MDHLSHGPLVRCRRSLLLPVTTANDTMYTTLGTRDEYRLQHSRSCRRTTHCCRCRRFARWMSHGHIVVRVFVHTSPYRHPLPSSLVDGQCQSRTRSRPVHSRSTTETRTRRIGHVSHRRGGVGCRAQERRRSIVVRSATYSTDCGRLSSSRTGVAVAHEIPTVETCEAYTRVGHCQGESGQEEEETVTCDDAMTTLSTQGLTLTLLDDTPIFSDATLQLFQGGNAVQPIGRCCSTSSSGRESQRVQSKKGFQRRSVP